MWEVMRLLVVLDKGIVIIIAQTKGSQGQFMETFLYYLCWEVRVVVEGPAPRLVLVLVAAARS
jgi:hypothetical protein